MGCVLWVGEHVCDQVHVIYNTNILLHHKVTNDLISADLEIIPGGSGLSGRQWGCLFVGFTFI